jgi:hypothetical protein
MFDNTITTIFTLMSKDNEDPFKQSEQLESLYEIATNTQKKAIDNAFICICGYSLDTIINSSESISMEDDE